MIPIRLILEGVHSYRQRQEIDFTRLTGAGIFGIFGRVGSGKSTILEAITYALYGQIERLTKNEPYSMTNLRAELLLIDFECRAGKDNVRYRFRVEGKRNGKKFEDVKFKHDSYQWMDESDNWVPIACKNPAESILKLSYDNFKRTVIIPQGKFQDFIELNPTARSKMMMELFGLNRFDLSGKTERLVSINKEQLSQLNGRLAQLGDATPDKLAQAQLDLTNTNLLIAVNKATICTKQAQDTALDERWKKIQALKIAAEIFEALTAQKDFMETLEKSVREYENCAKDFKPLFDKRLDQQKTKESAEKNQANTTGQITQNAAELARCEAQLLTLRVTYDAREGISKRAEALLVLARLKEINASINVKNLRVENGEITIKTKENEIALLKQSRINLENQQDVVKKVQLDLAKLTDVKSWFEEYNNLDNNKKKIHKESHEIVAKIEQVNNEKFNLLIDYQRIDQANSIPKIQEKLQNEVEEIELEFEKIGQQLEKMLVRDQLKEYAANLQEGDPCPLCGAEHHPNLDTHGNAQKDINAARLRQATLKKRVEVIRKTRIDLGLLQANLTNYEARNIEIKTAWAAQKEKINAHELNFVWPEFDKNQPQGIIDAFDTAKKQNKDIENIGKEIKIIQDKITANEADVLKYKAPLDDIKREISQAQNEANVMRGQILGVDLSDFEHFETEDLTKESNNLKKQVETIVERFEKEDKKRQNMVSQCDVLNGQLMTIQQNVQTATNDLAKIQNELDQKILASAFESETQIRQILGEAIDLENQKKNLLKYRTDFIVAQKTYESQRSQIGEVAFDSQHHEALKAELLSLNATIDEYQKEAGRLETVQEQLRMQLKNQAELLKEKHKLELRQADLSRMTSLFRATGFVNYVSEVYLQNLARQANERFHRMTSQQLQLEVGDGNSFMVRDLLNNGKTRALNTLSGGQRFQAALCLALALADNVHVQLQSHENFFFLDEGFGSLDKESLQTVFDTLKSLRKENRIVGVISHVEDLQQEMDVYLKIENCEEKGSMVQCF